MTPSQDEPLSRARGAEFLASIESTCMPRIKEATVPILGVQDDEIRHDRTGVLYQVGGHHFVLTAAHRLRQFVQHSIPLYLSVNAAGIAPFPLADARFHTTEEDGRDVAAIWLPPDMGQELARHKRFLFHNQINLRVAAHRTPFVFFGYPMGWSGRVIAANHIHSRGLAFLSFRHEGDVPEPSLSDAGVHLLLTCTSETLDLRTRNSASLPSLRGISGCGIWQVGDLTPTGLHPRSSESVTLIGIQHSWSPNHGYVRGTRIGYALSLITAYYPETEAAMNVAYPAR